MNTTNKALTAPMLAALVKLAGADEIALPARTGTALVSRGLATVCVDADSALLRHNFGRARGRYTHFYSFTYKITGAGRSALEAV